MVSVASATLFISFINLDTSSTFFSLLYTFHSFRTENTAMIAHDQSCGMCVQCYHGKSEFSTVVWFLVYYIQHPSLKRFVYQFYWELYCKII